MGFSTTACLTLFAISGSLAYAQGQPNGRGSVSGDPAASSANPSASPKFRNDHGAPCLQVGVGRRVCGRVEPGEYFRRSKRQRGNVMLKDEDVAILRDIQQSIAFADDKHGEVEKLIIEGYVLKDGDIFELTPKGEKIVEDRAATLGEAADPET